MTEIGVLGAGGDDEMVVENAASLRDYLFARGIDPRDFRQDHLRVLLAPQDAADRRGDVSGRQPGGRDLIEQRLEEVIVVAIDDGDVERCSRQLLGRRQPAESRPDDHDARASARKLNGAHDTARLSRRRNSRAVAEPDDDVRLQEDREVRRGLAVRRRSLRRFERSSRGLPLGQGTDEGVAARRKTVDLDVEEWSRHESGLGPPAKHRTAPAFDAVVVPYRDDGKAGRDEGQRGMQIEAHSLALLDPQRPERPCIDRPRIRGTARSASRQLELRDIGDILDRRRLAPTPEEAREPISVTMKSRRARRIAADESTRHGMERLLSDQTASDRKTRGQKIDRRRIAETDSRPALRPPALNIAGGDWRSYIERRPDKAFMQIGRGVHGSILVRTRHVRLLNRERDDCGNIDWLSTR